MDKKLTQLLLLCESLTLSKKKPVLREREREIISFYSRRLVHLLYTQSGSF
jgi:hypothetical protein